MKKQIEEIKSKLWKIGVITFAYYPDTSFVRLMGRKNICIENYEFNRDRDSDEALISLYEKMKRKGYFE